MSKESRAVEAHRILESEVTKEAFAKLETHYMRTWREATEPKDLELREDMHRSILMLERFKSYFRSLITTGKLDAHSRQEEEST